MAGFEVDEGKKCAILFSLKPPAEAEASPQNQTVLNSFNQDLISLKIHCIVE